MSLRAAFAAWERWFLREEEIEARVRRVEHEAYVRFARASDRTDAYVFPGQPRFERAEMELHQVGDGSMLLASESMPGAFCYMGAAVALVREIAPYIDDVRFFFYDQVSWLDEVWVVDRTFYMRRHPVSVDDFHEVIRHLDGILQRERIEDRALGAYLAEKAALHAGGCISHLASAYLDAAALRRQAEELMAVAARYDGEEPPYLRAKLCLRDDDPEGAIAALERAIERVPAWRDPIRELARLYLDDGRTTDALAMIDRVVAMGRAAERCGEAARGAEVCGGGLAVRGDHRRGARDGHLGGAGAGEVRGGERRARDGAAPLSARRRARAGAEACVCRLTVDTRRDRAARGRGAGVAGDRRAVRPHRHGRGGAGRGRRRRGGAGAVRAARCGAVVRCADCATANCAAT